MADYDYIDANIFIRFLTQDDQVKAKKCEKLFMEVSCGAKKLKVTDICIAEIIWVLDSYYGLSKTEIAEKIVSVLNTPGLVFSNRVILLDAVRRYKDKNVDFADAYHASLMGTTNSVIYSYDRDFDKFDDAFRKEP